MGFFSKLIGLSSQVGTSLVNNALSQYNAKQQRDWQEKMMDKANAYNSPLAQSLRMRSAGLNPYQDMGAVPSASAGTGVAAQTIPMGDPLAGAFTLAQIRNMDAQTGKTVTETDKILQEITNLELLYQKGIIEKDELEFRVNKLKEAWSEKSQYQADLEKTEAEAEKISAEGKVADEQALKVESDRLFTEALTATENSMRDVKVALAKAQTASANASANASNAQAAKLLLEGETIQLQNERDALRNSAIQFYGFDPTALSPEFAATLMNNFAAVVESNYNPKIGKEAMDKCHSLLKYYREKAIWTPTTTSYSWNSSLKLGDFSVSNGQSSTISN